MHLEKKSYKMRTILLIVLLSCCLSFASTDEQKEYKAVSTDLITADMCSQKPFKRLHICVALKKNRRKLKKAIEDYSCLFSRIESSGSLFPGPKFSSSSLHQTFRPANGTNDGTAIQTSSRSNSTRGEITMSGAVGFEVKTSLSLSSHRIRKRSTSTGGLNPCAGNLQQVIIYEAEDWQDGTVHELVHDPDSHLYQSFFIRNCNSYRISGMQCLQDDIIYKTLVYLHPPGEGDEVGTKYIRTKGTCALSLVQN